MKNAKILIFYDVFINEYIARVTKMSTLTRNLGHLTAARSLFINHSVSGPTDARVFPYVVCKSMWQIGHLCVACTFDVIHLNGKW